jgi:tripartite-type tricarboxylate transporter receptor subunit TctC
MRLHHIAVIALSVVGSTAAYAQSFPNKPLRIVVGSAPGGGTDSVSRILAQHLPERLGQPVVVENRSGGSGNIAADAVYRANPDGYTLLTVPGSAITTDDLVIAGASTQSHQLEAVSILTSMPLALVVRNDFPAKDVKELIDQVRQNPSKFTIANNGIGAASHLTAELFMQVTGGKLIQVPYKGTNPVLTDLLPGHVDMTFIPYGLFYELHQAKRVRILAIAGKQRLAVLPDIPTMAELGYPDIVSDTWNILCAPPGTPNDILTTLNQTVGTLIAEPKVQAQFAKLHMLVVGGDIEAAKKHVAADREHWSKIIKAANIKPQ